MGEEKRVFRPSDLPAAQVYGLVVGSVSPRPIAFVSSISLEGVLNLAPFSFFNGGGSNPPSVVFSPVRRRDGSEKDTLRNIKATGEYVINVATYTIREAMNQCSSEYPPEVSEFEEAGFTPVPSLQVRPPRVLEAPINMECRLYQVVEHGDGPLSANYVIGEVICFHVAEVILGEGLIHPPKVGFIGRLGGPWYTRTGPETMFEMERPR